MMKEALRFAASAIFWRMAVFWTISLLIPYFRLLTKRIFSRRAQSYPRCLPPISESLTPVCVITGATSRLGAAAAYAISREGLYVVLVGRSPRLLSKLLINNAGILATSSRITPEGYDQMMGTNYIGALCLSKFTLPLLKRSPVPSRIVNVTNSAQRINLVMSLAADPGCVRTNIMREVPLCLSNLAFQVLKPFGLLQSPENGISSILDAALAPPEVSGVYFFGGEATLASKETSRFVPDNMS
ncbi:ARM repeat superfamily protein [Hibiscus syriacus]|uniref:ARM repeat superfamily protein n=1 Tax=Hibiscus syriacus TaxID=106335 RepID=A0A6A3CRA8_HIBSY|nr:ARM repeat superfamily protein [Hibiscus syriacus]